MDEEKQARQALNKIASVLRFSFQESDGDRIYDRFKVAFQEVSDILNTLVDPTKTHERIGKRHPAAFYVSVKERTFAM